MVGHANSNQPNIPTHLNQPNIQTHLVQPNSPMHIFIGSEHCTEPLRTHIMCSIFSSPLRSEEVQLLVG